MLNIITTIKTGLIQTKGTQKKQEIKINLNEPPFTDKNLTSVRFKLNFSENFLKDSIEKYERCS